MIRNSFVFYKSWKDAISGLPDAIRLEVYEATIRYAFGETVEGLGAMASIAFNFIKTDIDRLNESYTAMVNRNRENGKKGGAPKGNKNAQKSMDWFKNNHVVEKSTEINPNDNEEDNDDSSTLHTRKNCFDLSKSNLYRKPKIPKFEQVNEFFSRNGATQEMAQKFYQKWEAVGI